ncbi:hypothetical protein KDA_51700 [Dictyobacter alpinus]|uniref:Photosynthesis system II assembly factor Ycf48/Hcf136-like domain-containing protein n=1 Tax=Dictyobacter alpinus TaxID=2014873 RepID=A0A402BEF0_9CHLR|nr:hypothetical protein [Dictyobacter alpinus]GCE29686.1 hypothetical protein KDA_51700 [Dictyobacter alpinus]
MQAVQRRQQDAHGLSSGLVTPVLALACAPGELWAGGSGGIAYQVLGTPWRSRTTNLPLTGITVLTHCGDRLIAGGTDGVAYSYNGGHTWQRGALQEGRASVTALVSSPCFSYDHVALVGTLESGILRSDDGGSTWRSAQFGLQSFEITALLWVDHDNVLAGTPDGLYRSPNAGRAWQLVPDMLDLPIAALARSPAHQLIAATEEGTLHMSSDNGLHWEPYPIIPADLQPTALHITNQDTRLLGCATQGLLRQDPASCAWSQVLPVTPLVIVQQDSLLWVGSSEGIWMSMDDGLNWQPMQPPPIADLSQLLVYKDTLLSAGVQSGLYRYGPGHGWQPLLQGLPILSVASLAEQGWLLAATPHGLYRGDEAKENWQQSSENELTHLSFCADGFGLGIIAHSSHLVRTYTAGEEWEEIATPFGILPVAALIVHKQIAFVVTYDPRLYQARIWHSMDCGETWTAGIEISSIWATVASCQEPLLLAIGNTLLVHRQRGEWQRMRCEARGEVRRMLWLQEHLLLLTTSGLFSVSLAAQTWVCISEQALLDIAVLDQQCYGLLPGGTVIRVF